MPELTGDSGSVNTTSRNQALSQHKATFDSRQAVGVNVNKLPRLSGAPASALVDSAYTAINTLEEAKRKKKVFMSGD